MQVFEILEVKEFTKLLFMTDIFDKFTVVEAEFHTFVKYDINCKLNKPYFDEEENRDFCTWGETRPICFGIIKGKRRPTFFKLIFKFSEEFKRDWIKSNTTKDIDGDLYLNIRYSDKEMNLISSFSPKTFLLDREIINAFDLYVKNMFGRINITVEETGE